MMIMGWQHIAVLLTPAAFCRDQYWCDTVARGGRHGTPVEVRGAMVSCVTDSQTATPDAGSAGCAKLMIVDDDPAVRIIVAEFLQESGYQVIQAGSGAEALDLLAHTPGLHMIISDIRMPDMSGIELADLATQRLLRKPFRMRDLEAAVRAELSA
jgi:ActR/RegA family two-component response regulator